MHLHFIVFPVNVAEINMTWTQAPFPLQELLSCARDIKTQGTFHEIAPEINFPQLQTFPGKSPVCTNTSREQL